MAEKTGHYARMRDRFLKNGLDNFADYEVVEMLLKLAQHRPDHRQTAKDLVAEFGGLRSVLDADPADLQKINGVGPANIFGLKLTQEVATRYLESGILQENYVSSSNMVVKYLQHRLSGKSREHFLMLSLASNNRIIAVDKLFEGSINSSAVYPREVIRLVLRRNAAAVIFVHNHPSGNLNPSQSDRELTRRLQDACKVIDVALHDHLIIAGDGYLSFMDEGLL